MHLNEALRNQQDFEAEMRRARLDVWTRLVEHPENGTIIQVGFRNLQKYPNQSFPSNERFDSGPQFEILGYDESTRRLLVRPLGDS